MIIPIHKHVAAFAERPFLIEVERNLELTYSEFHGYAFRMAGLLSTHGLQHGDRVGLLMENRAEFAVAYFACLYLGAVAVPLNPQLPPKDLLFLLSHSNLRALAYHQSIRKLLSKDEPVKDDIVLLPLEEEFFEERYMESDVLEGEGSIAACDVNEDDLFAIMFTSGTTSRPKGVPHCVGSLFGAAKAFNTALCIGPDHRFYHVLPMTYMAGFLNNLLCPFLAGSSVVCDRAFNAMSSLHFWKAPMRYKTNAMWLVPTMLSSLLKLDRNPDSASFAADHIHTLCVGTAPLSLDLKRRFEERYGVTIYESYGLSETLFATTNGPDLPYRVGSVGQAIEGVDIRITDCLGNTVPVNEDGNIMVRSIYKMEGYLNYEVSEPEPSTVDKWFETGDLGHLDKDGYLFITGRKKDLIIRGGINISPRAIEEVLLEQPLIEDVAVVGLTNEFYGESIVAAIEVNADLITEEIKAEWISACKKQLGDTCVPDEFVIVEQLPRSTTGKVQKARLRESLLSEGHS